MGRTLPTFNLILEHEMDEWRPFRRALRREDQEVFDRLFTMAKRHMAEAAYVARPVPFDTLVLAILLEQQKEIERLESEVRSQKSEVRMNNKNEIPFVYSILPKSTSFLLRSPDS